MTGLAQPRPILPASNPFHCREVGGEMIQHLNYRVRDGGLEEGAEPPSGTLAVRSQTLLSLHWLFAPGPPTWVPPRLMRMSSSIQHCPQSRAVLRQVCDYGQTLTPWWDTRVTGCRPDFLTLSVLLCSSPSWASPPPHPSPSFL